MGRGLTFFDFLIGHPGMQVIFTSSPDGIDVSIFYKQGNKQDFGALNRFSFQEARGMDDRRLTNELSYLQQQAMFSHENERGGDLDEQ